MNNSEFRKLTAAELRFLTRMLPSDMPHLRDLQVKLAEIRVSDIDEFGSLRFDEFGSPIIAEPDGPLVNAVQADADTRSEYGPYVNYIIFVKNGRLNELQVYKDDGSEIKNRLDCANILDVFPGRYR